MGLQTLRGREMSESSVVVYRYQIGDGPPVVPEKTRGNFLRLDHLAGQTRKIEQRAVFSPLFECLGELRRPARQSHFPAIDMNVVESRAGEGARILHQLRRGLRKMPVHGLFAHGV